MTKEFRKIDLISEKSELVQDIMDKKPTWIVRWGNTVIFFAFCTLVFLTWLVKYPDIIIAKITLTQLTPPITLISKATGPIAFFVDDHHLATKGEAIGYIRNPIDFREAQMFRDSMDYIMSDFEKIRDPSMTLFLEKTSNLGSMQARVNDFKAQIKKYQFNINYQPAEKEIAKLKVQIDHYQKVEEALQENIKTASIQFSLAQKDYERDAKLFAQSVLTAKEIESKERELLSVKSILEVAEIKKRETMVSIALLQTTLVRLINERERLEQELRSSIENIYQELITDMDVWREKFVLTAPESGTVSFFKFWKNEQFVFEGNEVVTIIPEDESRIIGRVESPLHNSGKIKIGQRVNILLDSYPYIEYGPLIGRVESISSLPHLDTYMLQVSLTDGLVTTFNKKIEFKHEMTGTAEIVTEDIRLIQRIFFQVTRSLRKNN